MAGAIPIAAGILALVYLFLVSLDRLTRDAREPQSISDAIPFITPTLSMASHGNKFYQAMRDKYKLPIYTLRLPFARIYVINSPSLITSVQSQFRTLSFAAVQAKIAASLLGVSESTNAIIGHNVTSDAGYLMSFPKYVHSALSAGPGLDAMNRRSIQDINNSLNFSAKQGAATIDLFQWVRHELLMASTEGVYGPKNPFRYPSMEKAWYAFEPDIMSFVPYLLPDLSTRKSFEAREYMVKVWELYFESGWHEQGSELIKARVKINNDFQIPLKETARIELGGSQAILTNSPPGAFWFTYHIFSDPVVLDDIRAELMKGVHTDNGTRTIDLSHVKSSCPILLSTFMETMRFHSSSIDTRIAMDDYLLDGKYLLKKGSIIIMPSVVQHTNREVWGDNVDEFVHRRFLRDPSGKRINPVAFRAFGGGTTLCPGRHFASTEILMFAAILVLRFDLRPVTGKWSAPTTARSPMINALPVPDWDIQVELQPRDGGALWSVSFSGHDDKSNMEMAAEDIEGLTPNLGH